MSSRTIFLVCQEQLDSQVAVLQPVRSLWLPCFPGHVVGGTQVFPHALALVLPCALLRLACNVQGHARSWLLSFVRAHGHGWVYQFKPPTHPSCYTSGSHIFHGALCIIKLLVREAPLPIVMGFSLGARMYCSSVCIVLSESALEERLRSYEIDT